MAVCESVAVPFVDLVTPHATLREELVAAFERVLEHGRFVLGPQVGELEAAWASRCAVDHAVAVSDGTTALWLVLEGLGIGSGDEVITAPNSFVASASCIVHAGAVPRFADVGEDLNVDPEAIRRCITPKTRAIIAVHLTGRPAAMAEIEDVAAEHDLRVIEDAAQAMGARYRGAPTGSLADAGCFSLHPLKTIGACGDAGMITTNDAELAERLRLLRNHGIEWRQEDCRTWGYNARMDTLQAALALVKLPHLNGWIERRRRNAAIYRERLPECVRIPRDRPEDFAVYHTFPVQVHRRDELVERLQRNDIGCAVHYRTPIHLLEVARELGYRPGDLPVAERQAQRVIALPIHQELCEEQVHHVCDVIDAFYGRT